MDRLCRKEEVVTTFYVDFTDYTPERNLDERLVLESRETIHRRKLRKQRKTIREQEQTIDELNGRLREIMRYQGQKPCPNCGSLNDPKCPDCDEARP